jgi:hypothetical protein
MTATAERETTKAGKDTNGRVVRVTGPVVDVEFPRGAVPGLFNALHTDITFSELAKTLTLEVALHLGAALKSSTPERRSLYRSAMASRAMSSIRWATASTKKVTAPTLRAGRSTASRRRSTSSNLAPRCWKRG